MDDPAVARRAHRGAGEAAVAAPIPSSRASRTWRRQGRPWVTQMDEPAVAATGVGTARGGGRGGVGVVGVGVDVAGHTLSGRE
jgi:hypothetical protein